MSSHPNAHAGHHAQSGHGTLNEYLIGFVLSVILTVIPFWLVMADVLDSKSATVGWILGLGLVQMIVHLVYFLHLKPSTEGGWTLITLVGTVLTVAVCLVGSIWIVNKLHSHMMPHHQIEYVPESSRDIIRR
ncbi:cytochrome o ubiquinol oxidase subunit IV [Vandammella animalimorsus]|uniref:Cytochrome bo(3) ubiquinol oxidase subunit 4 n=1 Tax=Vandammella animalimorsus TaxID=2029117 RepID=A0A2A2T1Q6_9BURK|nr:cytochrome o ubiquinol oxidase subunit IV [Vandammella animalimorsus]RRD67401.1 cytochrome o ubiquinol oxidase subunit IV [Comamonadaceae bacterium OH2310_COT-174]PAT31687.1 cytochrome o ubiquinol oxidase subunit IV [Vandammella animalimorsus]PAT35744.1 cytochrome o ubiquinol oxidase subunit IV [Vandammella animalimorsus]PAX15466.1 cytochrome o ubiquinol oxidase subunit IV [Vandammella animalimorsus]PAX17219.1 cytochrome o ubiquinol oxidase subunit IV [Vandammella animalimorsus]